MTTRPHAEPARPPGPEADPHLSVWPTAQRDARAQRRGRYLPESTAHPAKMLPAIAATAIARYTRPGDLVADPMCGIGTTLVEAVHLGRDGLGIEYEPRWAAVAAANVSHARRNGATGTAEVIRGDARQLPALLPARRGRAGRAGRHLAALRPVRPRPGHGRAAARRAGRGPQVRQPLRPGPRQPRPARAWTSSSPGSPRSWPAARCCCAPAGWPWSPPGPGAQHGELVDLPAAVIAAGARAGLVPVARCVALLAGLRGGRLIARPSFFQLDNLRRARRQGQPWHLIVHEDVLIFRNPLSRRFGSRPPAACARGTAAGRPAGPRPRRGPGRVSTLSAQHPAARAGGAADRRQPVQRHGGLDLDVMAVTGARLAWCAEADRVRRRRPHPSLAGPPTSATSPSWTGRTCRPSTRSAPDGRVRRSLTPSAPDGNRRPRSALRSRRPVKPEPTR